MHSDRGRRNIVRLVKQLTDLEIIHLGEAGWCHTSRLHFCSCYNCTTKMHQTQRRRKGKDSVSKKRVKKNQAKAKNRDQNSKRKKREEYLMASLQKLLRYAAMTLFNDARDSYQMIFWGRVWHIEEFERESKTKEFTRGLFSIISFVHKQITASELFWTTIVDMFHIRQILKWKESF